MEGNGRKRASFSPLIEYFCIPVNHLMRPYRRERLSASHSNIEFQWQHQRRTQALFPTPRGRYTVGERTWIRGSGNTDYSSTFRKIEISVFYLIKLCGRIIQSFVCGHSIVINHLPGWKRHPRRPRGGSWGGGETGARGETTAEFVPVSRPPRDLPLVSDDVET